MERKICSLEAGSKIEMFLSGRQLIWMKYVNWIEKQFGRSVNVSVLFQNTSVKNKIVTVMINGTLKNCAHNESKLSFIFPSCWPPKHLRISGDKTGIKMLKFTR